MNVSLLKKSAWFATKLISVLAGIFLGLLLMGGAFATDHPGLGIALFVAYVFAWVTFCYYDAHNDV